MSTGRRLLGALAALFALACAGAMQSGGDARAASSVTVSLTVASATDLDASLCATGSAGRTDFGTVLPGQPYVSGTDCTITWGSTNDSAALRVGQLDSGGTAM